MSLCVLILQFIFVKHTYSKLQPSNKFKKFIIEENPKKIENIFIPIFSCYVFHLCIKLVFGLVINESMLNITYHLIESVARFIGAVHLRKKNQVWLDLDKTCSVYIVHINIYKKQWNSSKKKQRNNISFICLIQHSDG